MRIYFNDSKVQVAIIASLVYFVQGALGISAIAIPIYFRSLGWTISDIAMTSSLISLPWIFKIAYGFLSDSFPLFGLRRKSYLFLYLFLSVVGWLAFAQWGTTQLSVIAALWVANLGFAGTDVITDGLIVENSDGDWGHTYQSLAWGFRSFGAVVTGFLGGWLVLHFSPQTIFFMTAGLPLLAVVPLMIFHESRATTSFSLNESAAQFQKVMRFCFVRRHLLFILFFGLSSSSVLFGTPFFFHMREKLFFADDYLGFLISLGWAGAIIGSVAFARWMKNVSMANLFYLVVIFNVVNILSTYALRDVISAAWLIFFGGVVGGMAILPLMSASAVLTKGSGVEGTLFALLMGFYNLSQIAWGFLGGKLFALVGLNWLIAIAALMQTLGFFLISHLIREND